MHARLPHARRRAFALTLALACAACSVPVVTQPAATGHVSAKVQPGTGLTGPSATPSAAGKASPPAGAGPVAGAPTSAAPSVDATKAASLHGFILTEAGAPIANAIISTAGFAVTSGAPADAENLAPAPGQVATVAHDFGDGKGPVLSEKRPRRAGSAGGDGFVYLRRGEYLLETIVPGPVKLSVSFLGTSQERVVEQGLGQTDVNVTMPGVVLPATVSGLAVASPTPAATPAGPATPTPAATGLTEATPTPAAGTPTPAGTTAPIPSVVPRALQFVALTPLMSMSLKIKSDRHCGDPLNEIIYSPADGNVAATIKAPTAQIKISELQVFFLTEGTGPGLVPPVPPHVKVTFSPARVIMAGASSEVPFSLKSDLLKSFYADPAFDGTNLIARCLFKDEAGAFVKGTDSRRLSGDIFINKGI